MCGGYKIIGRTFLNSLENLVFILMQNTFKFLLSLLKNKQEIKDSRGFIPPFLSKKKVSVLSDFTGKFQKRRSQYFSKVNKMFTFFNTERSIAREYSGLQRALKMLLFLIACAVDS